MPASRRTPWLICYDIADRRRLVQVNREVSRCAWPFQYSVFRADANRKDIARSLARIALYTDPNHDDLRAYPLLTTADPFTYGRNRLPAGVSFFDSPAPLLQNLDLFED